ncbi:GLUG motif-containing protein [Methanimicrococcus blatticola]|uniref:GLUG motif-containing protein n=1 Tax=Methanimicrococcus blatticola TaxID=91560 RepID=A0A484F363_9EURY|nr:GLUG motif-containing protein [Methanimicrococcus blatticola]MBZ3936430.1 hypothetical protein [Methanimicrococcus blatticola]MCC2509490.1 hypothetical protein [Methanimicrococcus blatticola]TDQ67541.1 GLUG motif-containing protein [Methanimicrococcus blatticola]
MHNKKTIIILLILAAVSFLAVSDTVIAADGSFGVEPGAAGLHGSVSNPFIIEDVEDLKAIQTHISKSNDYTKDKYYKIGDEVILNLENMNWIPLGDEKNIFGNFDGNSGGGAKITNLTISSTTQDNVGLFGALAHGKLSNITIENATIISSHNNVGILIGNSSYMSIQNCCVTGKIETAEKTIGGLAGSITGGTVNNCNSDVNIDATDGTVGGFAGHIGNGTIRQCYSKGNVETDAGIAGGFAGETDPGGDLTLISECYATGNVKTGGNFAGGLIGNTSITQIENCYATGNVEGKNAGGLIGQVASTDITTCYATGNVDAENYAGGLFGKVYCIKKADGFEDSSGLFLKNLNNNMALNEFVNGTYADYIGFYGNDYDGDKSYATLQSEHPGQAVIENMYAWNGITNKGKPIKNSIEETDILIVDYDEINFVKSYHVWQQYENKKSGDSKWDSSVWKNTVWQTNHYDEDENENKFHLPIFKWQDEDHEKPIADAVHILYLTEIQIGEGPYNDKISRNFNITIDPKEVDYSHEYYNNWKWNLYAALTDDQTETTYNESSNFSVSADIRSGTQSVYVTKKVSSLDLSKSFDPKNDFYAWGKTELIDPYNGPGKKYATERISEREAFKIDEKNIPATEEKGGGSRNGNDAGKSGKEEIQESMKLTPSTPAYEKEDEEVKVISSLLILSFGFVAIAVFAYRRRDENGKDE